MRKIFKYRLFSDVNEIDLPEDPKIVLVGPDYNSDVCIWVELDVDETLTKQRIYVFGTGIDIHDSALEHVGSCKNGSLIWHVYIKPHWISSSGKIIEV